MKYRNVAISADALARLRQIAVMADPYRPHYRKKMEELIAHALADLNGKPTPPKPKVKTLWFLLSPDGFEQLEDVANHWGVSRREALERIIKQYKE